MPDLLPDPPAPRELVILEPVGRAGGPTWGYGGARITSNARGTQFAVKMPGTPFDGWGGMGSVDQIVRLVDWWVDKGKLPPPYILPEGWEPKP